MWKTDTKKEGHYHQDIKKNLTLLEVRRAYQSKLYWQIEAHILCSPVFWCCYLGENLNS